MVMRDAEFYANRQPAVRVGGQRPRNRLSRVPRSNTAPNLVQSESVTGGARSNVGLGRSASPQEGADATHRQESESALGISQSMMMFYPPSVLPFDFSQSSPDHDHAPRSASPASTTESSSTSSIAVSSSKKNSFKVPFRTSSRMPPPPSIESASLPPNTPTKAAKLLGLSLDRERVGSPLVAQHDGVFDSDYDTVIQEPARERNLYSWAQPYAAPESAASSETVTSKFREEGLHTDPPKSKGFWSKTKKAAKKLAPLTFLRPTSQPLPPHISVASAFTADMSADDMLTNFVYRVNPEHTNVRIQDPPPPCARAAPVPSSHRRNHNRNHRRAMDMMAPITETSLDDMSAYHPVEEDTTPEAISEDTTTDDSTKKENDMVHGRPVELSKALPSIPAQTQISVQSPLQVLEGNCLNAVEDSLMETLKKSHEDLKREFARTTGCVCGHNISGDEYEDDDDDLASISSSIDIEEYQHTAVVMMVRRVLPGEVKLVDIPARKK
ncbi:hypothetical protein CC86DRAFT_380507 [Ophiobolus disseminans]|uniref:Uncharacterized protein n=1 Tax=Ophiobolus disseminans TaxID=1469910 RepID=A0A6A7A7M4_9PLEO|nr:hypothetical protein CC86DRAFT_380507 [Ophiobolus disseminans]